MAHVREESAFPIVGLFGLVYPIEQFPTRTIRAGGHAAHSEIPDHEIREHGQDKQPCEQCGSNLRPTFKRLTFNDLAKAEAASASARNGIGQGTNEL